MAAAKQPAAPAAETVEVMATITLYTAPGKPAVPPGGTLALPAAEAAALVGRGHAAPVPALDPSPADVMDPNGEPPPGDVMDPNGKAQA